MYFRLGKISNTFDVKSLSPLHEISSADGNLNQKECYAISTVVGVFDNNFLCLSHLTFE
jgi:hypothetical protein